jgi:hypothetical protein
MSCQENLNKWRHIYEINVKYIYEVNLKYIYEVDEKTKVKKEFKYHSKSYNI